MPNRLTLQRSALLSLRLMAQARRPTRSRSLLVNQSSRTRPPTSSPSSRTPHSPRRLPTTPRILPTLGPRNLQPKGSAHATTSTSGPMAFLSVLTEPPLLGEMAMAGLRSTKPLRRPTVRVPSAERYRWERTLTSSETMPWV